MKMNGYCHHYKQFLNPGKRCHCQSNSFRFGVTCFDNNNTCSNNCVQNKTQSYVEQTLGNDFIPLAIETYSYLHPCFDSFLISCVHAYIVRHQQTSLVPSMHIYHYRQQMSIALQRAQAITILQQVATFNHNSSSLPHIPTSAHPSLANLWQMIPFQNYVFHFIIIVFIVLIFLLCLHLLQHAFYFLGIDFHSCLYIYKVSLIHGHIDTQSDRKMDVKKFLLCFCLFNECARLQHKKQEGLRNPIQMYTHTVKQR